MESAVSIFQKLPETKDQVSSYVSLLKKSVLNGEVDPLKFMAQVSAFELMLKQLKGDHLIKDCVLEEAEKHNAKSFELSNAKYQIKEVGVKYDFSDCNDLEYTEALDSEKEAKEKRIGREKILKTLTPETELYGKDGTQLELPKKTSTTQVVITLK
jgi:hypothetical protein